MRENEILINPSTKLKQLNNLIYEHMVKSGFKESASAFKNAACITSTIAFPPDSSKAVNHNGKDGFTIGDWFEIFLEDAAGRSGDLYGEMTLHSELFKDLDSSLTKYNSGMQDDNMDIKQKEHNKPCDFSIQKWYEILDKSLKCIEFEKKRFDTLYSNLKYKLDIENLKNKFNPNNRIFGIKYIESFNINLLDPDLMGETDSNFSISDIKVIGNYTIIFDKNNILKFYDICNKKFLKQVKFKNSIKNMTVDYFNKDFKNMIIVCVTTHDNYCKVFLIENKNVIMDEYAKSANACDTTNISFVNLLVEIQAMSEISKFLYMHENFYVLTKKGILLLYNKSGVLLDENLFENKCIVDIVSINERLFVVSDENKIFGYSIEDLLSTQKIISCDSAPLFFKKENRLFIIDSNLKKNSSNNYNLNSGTSLANNDCKKKNNKIKVVMFNENNELKLFSSVLDTDYNFIDFDLHSHLDKHNFICLFKNGMHYGKSIFNFDGIDFVFSITLNNSNYIYFVSKNGDSTISIIQGEEGFGPVNYN